MDKMAENKKHIVLLGASISREWDIAALPERMKNSDYVFEYVHGGGPNKSKRLREVLSRKENKPDAIFLKQCAAYFPSDFEDYKGLEEQWIKECLDAGVVPIPTTVVPVTRLHPLKKFLIDIVKGRNPFKFGNPFKNLRNKSILEFNDWVRNYCKTNGLNLLDLEEAVSYSENNKYLREDLARIDGLHLNSKAYVLLDQIVIPSINTVNWESEDVSKSD